VLERFFDEAGGCSWCCTHRSESGQPRLGTRAPQAVLPQLHFELQAAATEDAIVLSLGAQHSFPLEDVFQYLSPRPRAPIVQAISTPRCSARAGGGMRPGRSPCCGARGGKKVPTPLQRMDAEDLIAAVFPDQLACPENLVGDREIPDHPLVQQTIADCLLEAMDFPGLKGVLEGMRPPVHARGAGYNGAVTARARGDQCQAIAFLDDAPLEERRTQAVITRRGLDVKTAWSSGSSIRRRSIG